MRFRIRWSIRYLLLLVLISAVAFYIKQREPFSTSSYSIKYDVLYSTDRESPIGFGMIGWRTSGPVTDASFAYIVVNPRHRLSGPNESLEWKGNVPYFCGRKAWPRRDTFVLAIKQDEALVFFDEITDQETTDLFKWNWTGTSEQYSDALWRVVEDLEADGRLKSRN